MFCKKDGIRVTGCSKWMGGDPQEICPQCVEKGSFDELDEKIHPDGQVDQLPPIKQRCSNLKHHSKGVNLVSTKVFLPHFGEKGKRRGEIAKGG